jgi:hypothetical protein
MAWVSWLFFMYPSFCSILEHAHVLRYSGWLGQCTFSDSRTINCDGNGSSTAPVQSSRLDPARDMAGKIYWKLEPTALPVQTIQTLSFSRHLPQAGPDLLGH